MWALFVPGHRLYVHRLYVHRLYVHRLYVHRLRQSQLVGLDALWHMDSSQARDLTHVPCIGRQILNQCTTREFPFIYFHSGI